MVDKLADAGIIASMFAVVIGLIEVIKSQLRKVVNRNDGPNQPDDHNHLSEIANQLRRSNEIQERVIAKLDIVTERQAVNSERLCTIGREIGEIKRKGAA